MTVIKFSHRYSKMSGMSNSRIDLRQAELLAEILSKEYPDVRDHFRDMSKILAAKSDALRMFPILVKELKECRER